jgi:hypothetical protein
MDLGGFAIVGQELIVHIIDNGYVTKLFSRGALKIFIASGIFKYLALRISLIVIEVGKCNSRRSRLVSAR